MAQKQLKLRYWTNMPVNDIAQAAQEEGLQVGESAAFTCLGVSWDLPSGGLHLTAEGEYYAHTLGAGELCSTVTRLEDYDPDDRC